MPRRIVVVGTAEAGDASYIETPAGSTSVPPSLLLNLRLNHASESSNVLVQSDMICLRRKHSFLWTPE